VAVEAGHARIFTLKHVRGATVADGLAELQVRWPTVPIVYCETRKLAEEWTYRYLAAAGVWARDEPAAQARIGMSDESPPAAGPPVPEPSSGELRAWARANGLTVSDRGRVAREIQRAWENTHRRSSAEE
jgi:Lsr2